ncbi:MAG TPA: hypothetical protein PKB06_10250, partial [Actinotalea sp.]|nr:hypothetical protein [Actinotalea sp.]
MTGVVTEVELGGQAGGDQVPAQVGQCRAERLAGLVGGAEQLDPDPVGGDVCDHSDGSDALRGDPQGQHVLPERCGPQRAEADAQLLVQRRDVGRRAR